MVHPAPRHGAADAPRARMPAPLWTVRIGGQVLNQTTGCGLRDVGVEGSGAERQASIKGAITPANHS